MTKLFLTGICWLFLFFTAKAQFSDSVNHYLGYSVSGIINQTDAANSFVLNNALKFNIHKKNKYLNSGASWVYGRQNGSFTNNDYNAALDFDIYATWPNFYYWGLLNYDKSYSLKINDRLQAGPGIGYNFLTGKNASVVLSDGILYEYSDLKNSDTSNSRYSTFRNSLRLKYHFVIGQIITIDGVHFWQPSLSTGNDYIIKSISTLAIKLKKWLSLTSALNYNQVNRTKSKNLLFTLGLSADYYF